VERVCPRSGVPTERSSSLGDGSPILKPGNIDATRRVGHPALLRLVLLRRRSTVLPGNSQHLQIGPLRRNRFQLRRGPLGGNRLSLCAGPRAERHRKLGILVARKQRSRSRRPFGRVAIGARLHRFAPGARLVLSGLGCVIACLSSALPEPVRCGAFDWLNAIVPLERNRTRMTTRIAHLLFTAKHNFTQTDDQTAHTSPKFSIKWRLYFHLPKALDYTVSTAAPDVSAVDGSQRRPARMATISRQVWSAATRRLSKMRASPNCNSTEKLGPPSAFHR